MSKKITHGVGMAASFLAYGSKYRGAQAEGALFHPLVYHALDVAACGLQLFD